MFRDGRCTPLSARARKARHRASRRPCSRPDRRDGSVLEDRFGKVSQR